MTMIPPTPLDRLYDVADRLGDDFPRDVAQELALMLDAEGVLDGLDDNDARHTLMCIVTNLLTGTGPDGILRQAAGMDHAVVNDPEAVRCALTTAGGLLYG